jgi:hypothetical protein
VCAQKDKKGGKISIETALELFREFTSCFGTLYVQKDKEGGKISIVTACVKTLPRVYFLFWGSVCSER